MTSITQLLSPWPTVTKSSIVLREQYIGPPATDPIDTPMQQQQQHQQQQQQQQQQPQQQSQALQQHAPSPPHDPDAVTGSAESDGGDNSTDGRKGYGKRELSTSKRAAQNRAAQRAFRQRKEGYIKKLEEQVRDYQVLSENFKAVQSENYQLRDYIINLQSRLLETQGEVPPPPSNVDGLSPNKAGQPPQAGTLPRLSELGAVGSQPDGLPHLESISRSGYPDPIYSSEPPSVKRLCTSPSEMTASQQALQGTSILTSGSPTTPR